MKGFRTDLGVMKWRMPSPAQAVVLIGIFVVPILAGVFFYDIIPSAFRIPIFIIWFIAAYAVYIYILMHGRGKQKSTIVEASALRGEFTIDNNWIAYLSIYPFAASIGAFFNRYYLAGAILILAGAALIAAGKYFRKKIRIDENGRLFIRQKGEELLIDFTRLSSVEGRLNKMSAESIYKPLIIFNFREGYSELNVVKLKVTVLKSVEYGTYSHSSLILQYIKYRCLENGFNLVYLNPEETDWRAEKL